MLESEFSSDLLILQVNFLCYWSKLVEEHKNDKILADLGQVY
jgi:hypothetical protein